MGRTFAVTLAASAFLLFTVQPMVARMLLPYLGGSAVVWNTCMVFFQAALVAGYLWAHYAPRLLGLGRSRYAQVALLLAGCAVFPIAIVPSADAATQPVGWLLTQLGIAVGLPFFALSASAPLLQRWYAAASDDDPYWLYSASNIGSFAALLAYPLVLEPLLGVSGQSLGWSVGYIVLIGLTGLSAFAARHLEDTDPAESERASWPDRLRWTLLAAIPAGLLIAVTTSISTDLASVPLLWVIPLGLYLLSFVVVFARRTVIPFDFARTSMVVLSVPFVTMLGLQIAKPIWILLPAHLLMFVAVCLVYHGELNRLRPAPEQLTDFYLWMSVGGVMGGFSVSIVAPFLLNDRWEYLLLGAVALVWLGRRQLPLSGDWRLGALGAVAGLGSATICVLGDRVSPDGFDAVTLAFFGCLTLVGFVVVRLPRYGMPALVLTGFAVTFLVASAQNVVEKRRSHFASYWVTEKQTSAGTFHLLHHGRVKHGAQAKAAPLNRTPLSYYHPNGPAGDVFGSIADDGDTRPIAVVGLGVGALAAYALPGQEMKFYEIDPVVAEIARDDRYFTYLADCEGDCTVVIGDGRVQLANEPDGSFQLMVLDAYNSDAIPTHLLTVEAMRLYLSKLDDDGLLLLHVSNTFLDVGRVAENVAAANGYAVFRYSWWPREKRLKELPVYRADYIVVARNQTVIRARLSRQWKKRVGDPDDIVWTDDYANIVGIYLWN